MNLYCPPTRKGKAGFSLAELTIVVVILGLVAMMGVPRYQTAVERGNAAEAFVFLNQVSKSQEKYSAEVGQYADQLDKLKEKAPELKHFKLSKLSSNDWGSKWEIKLTRFGPSNGFGVYTVVYNQDGFLPSRSSIPKELHPK